MQGQLEEKLGAVLAGRYMSLLWANAGKPRPEEGELRESVRRLVTDFHSRPLTIGLGLRLFGIDPLAKPLTIHVVGASHVETLNTRVTDYDELARMFPGQRGMEVVMVGVDVVDGPIMRPPLATPGPQGRIYLSSFKGLYHDFWEGQVETKVAARPDLVVGFHPGECPGCSTRGCWGLWDVPRAHHGCAPCHRGPPQAGGDTLGLGCQQHPKGSLHLGSRSRSWGSAQDPEPGGERGPSLLAASRCASQAFLGWEGQAVCPPLTDTSPQVSTPALTSWQAGCPRCCCCGTTACPPSSPSTGEPPGVPPELAAGMSPQGTPQPRSHGTLCSFSLQRAGAEGLAADPGGAGDAHHGLRRQPLCLPAARAGLLQPQQGARLLQLLLHHPAGAGRLCRGAGGWQR